MQSHGVFWLLPWLGDEKRPFTVITEYSKRLYSVVPGLQELCDVIYESGLVINRIFEPEVEEQGKKANARASSFANAFPQWWVFECVKLSKQNK